MIELPDIIIGRTLNGVRRLTVSYPKSVSMHEGIALDCGDTSIIIQTRNDTSEIEVSTGEFVLDCGPEDEQYYTIEDVSDLEIYAQVLNQPIDGWWEMVNNQGYTDGFAVLFGFSYGLVFIAMNNTVSVSAISRVTEPKVD